MRNPFHRRFRPSLSSQASSGILPPNISGSDSASAASTTSMVFRPPPPVSLSPGDRPMSFPPGYTVSAVEIRALNELIRKRYALDAEIWRLRDCKQCDKGVVEEKMGRADATLAKIQAVVRAWDRPDVWKEETDWERLRMIQRRLESGGKRVWAGNPPWRG